MAAPWVFVTLAVLFAGGGWAIGRFMYGERIENLKSRLERRDETITELKLRLDHPKLPATPPTPMPPKLTLPSLPPKIDKTTPAPAPAPAPVENGNVTSLRDMLTRRRRYFNFKPDARKPITFLENGSIGDGNNANEFRWVFEGDLLAIYRLDGHLQNVFRPNPDKSRFEYSPDIRAHGLKDQFIELRDGLPAIRL